MSLQGSIDRLAEACQHDGISVYALLRWPLEHVVDFADAHAIPVIDLREVWALLLERRARNILMRAQAAGVPLVVTFVRNRLQAAMLSAGEWPDGYAPKDIHGRVREIVEAGSGTFVDVLQRN